jgi:hypothetical protein
MGSRLHSDLSLKQDAKTRFNVIFMNKLAPDPLAFRFKGNVTPSLTTREHAGFLTANWN